jgi:hypothetical protein
VKNKLSEREREREKERKKRCHKFIISHAGGSSLVRYTQAAARASERVKTYNFINLTNFLFFSFQKNLHKRNFLS